MVNLLFKQLKAYFTYKVSLSVKGNLDVFIKSSSSQFVLVYASCLFFNLILSLIDSSVNQKTSRRVGTLKTEYFKNIKCLSLQKVYLFIVIAIKLHEIYLKDTFKGI